VDKFEIMKAKNSTLVPSSLFNPIHAAYIERSAK